MLIKQLCRFGLKPKIFHSQLRLLSSALPEDILTAKSLVNHIENIDESPHFYALQEIKNSLKTTLEEYEELKTSDLNS